MTWQERIVLDPEILQGKPVIKNTRLSVEFIVNLMSEGWTNKQIIKNYPQLTIEDIQAVLHYAAEVLKTEKVYPLTGTDG